MKNKLTRVMSVLLVLTLISTCAISGTFAKYTTGAEGEDAARVAQWGIVLTMDGDLFAEKYKTDDKTATVEYSVISNKEGEAVVAPGTTGDAFRATVKGTPEVATRYTLTIPAGFSDVVLPAGTYTDYTELVKAEDGTYGYTNTFTLDKDYAPIKWDITVTKGGTSMSLTEAAAAYPQLAAAMGGTANGFAATDAVTIVKTYKTQLEALILNMVSGASNAQFNVDDAGNITLSLDFEANKEMDFEFALKWTWDFDDNGAGTNDKADTFLGNVAAGVVEEVPAGVKTNLAATFKATATQID